MAQKDKEKISSLLKEIKGKIAKGGIVDDEILGTINQKLLKNDLLAMPSLFSEVDDQLGKKISKHLNSLSETFERDDRYERYRIAMKQPEVEGALDIYGSEITTQDVDGNILNVFSSSEKVADVVRDLYKRIGLEDKAFDISRNFCGYGDEFYEIIYTKNGKAIHSINQIPRELIGRVEKNGVLENFYLRSTKKMKESDSLYSFDYAKPAEDDEAKTIEPIRILHWRIPSSEYAPYGKSILDSVITPLEELRLMEQSLIIARITRSPERRLYYVNVGTAAGEKGIALGREIVSRMKRKNILDKFSGNMESNMDFFGATEDIVLPFRQDQEKSTVDTLPAMNDPGQLNDLEFIRDRIFPGLGIPRPYLFDDTFANANTNLSNKSVQFAKRIRRRQKDFIYNAYKLAFIECKLKGISDKEMEDLLITMNNPSNVDEREKIELETSRWTLLSTIKSMNAEKIFYSDYDLFKEVLGLNNEEILDIMIQNIAQETGKNPFALIPEDQRPKDYLILDQLKAPEETTGETTTDEDGNEVPDAADAAFGGGGGEEEPAPDEGGDDEGEAAPEEDNIELASYKNKKAAHSAAYFESIMKARTFVSKKKKAVAIVETAKESKKFTTAMYSESQLMGNKEFVGLETIKNKNNKKFIIVE